ncbi:MAG: LLM class F420-dependent oxidoreductase [Deltaproteobacteria bacterium]|nr:LLM class F420-dependent oxidoreductase [Deltaproteobacteria bacterium]
MQFGLHCSLGVGLNPTPDDYVRVACRAEELGYHSFWLGDHIVIPERITAPYPYTADGSVGFPRRTSFPDPFVILGYLAAKTQKILLGTSVIIVPYRNPLHVAKAVTTVDFVSGGRFLFGVGVGWLKEEFEALGENFAERGKRTREYLQVMKALWKGEPVSFQGEFVRFPEVHAVPGPVQKPHPPIIFGGESPAALRRVADLGDGWQPGPVALPVLQEKVSQLKETWQNGDEIFPGCLSRCSARPVSCSKSPSCSPSLASWGWEKWCCS